MRLHLVRKLSNRFFSPQFQFPIHVAQHMPAWPARTILQHFFAINWCQTPSTMSLAPTYFVVQMRMYTQNGVSHFLTGTKQKIKSMCVLSEKGEWMHAQRLLQVRFVPIEFVHIKVLSH